MPRRRRRIRRKILPEEKEEIIRLLKKGKSPAEVAKKLRLKLKTVYNIKYKYVGHETRNYRKLTPDELDAIKRWLEEGKSIYWIAKQLGRHTSTIHYAALRLGFPPRGEKIGSKGRRKGRG